VKKPIQREHILQGRVFRFTNHAIALTSDKYQFFSFDRSGQSGRFTHAREAERGVRRSTPDTLLEVVGMESIWWEAKDKGNEPTEEQYQMLNKLRQLRRFAGWGDCVMDYAMFLELCGVPLVENWKYQATVLDGHVDTLIARAEEKRDGFAKRPRATKSAPRYTAGKRFSARAKKAGIMI